MFVYSKIRDFHDAQDVTQEVFLQAYRNLRGLRRWESFAFWLYRIASNRCRKWLQVRSRRPDREFIEDQDERTLAELSMSSYHDIQVNKTLQEALDSLSNTYREVLMLYYFGGMNSVDIAKALGTSPTAIRHRLSRARSQLKQEMIAMMDTAFEGQKLQSSFTFRVVEAAKRLKISPAPRMAQLPWGLSLATAIFLAVMGFNPRLNLLSVVDGKIYAIGGYSSGGGTTFPAVEVYDPTTDRWTKKNVMSFARGSHSASVVKGKIYVIGGWGGFNNVFWFSTVEEYDPKTDTWIKKADMPTGKSDFLTEVVDGKIYAFGGFNGGFLSGVEVYDTATDTWTKKPNMPSVNAGYCTSLVNREIYVIGGAQFFGSCISDVKVYNPATGNWVDKADMPTARVDLSASVVNGKIYVIGGVIDEANNVPTVEEYTPEGWPFKPDRPVSPHGSLPKRWGEIKSDPIHSLQM